MNLARDERIVFDSVDKDCYVQSCVAASDQYDYQIFDQPKEELDKNSYYLEESRKAGVCHSRFLFPLSDGMAACAGRAFCDHRIRCYYYGQFHLGSMLQRRWNRGQLWSAICGRTPYWGYHVKENRFGTHLIHVEAELNSPIEWEVWERPLGRRNLPLPDVHRFLPAILKAWTL